MSARLDGFTQGREFAMDDNTPVPLEGARSAGAESGGAGTDAVPVPLEGARSAGAESGGAGTDAVPVASSPPAEPETEPES